MIAQVLNRDFLLGVVDDIQRGLERTIGERARRGPPGPMDDHSTAELREVSDALATAAASEVGRGAFPHPQVRGGMRPGQMRPKDDYAFVPRDPLMSIVQTVLEETVEDQKPSAIAEKPLIDDRRSASVPIVTDRQFRDVPLLPPSEGRRVWGPFEITRPKLLSDPRWLWSGVIIAWNRFRNRAQFNPVPAGPITIGHDVRIVLVGDWGSGLPRAQAVAGQIRRVLDDGSRERKEQYVVHLGDVYYTGGESEYRERFLKYWPVRPGEGIASFTLNGNHDMYQGGHAYFGECLADPRFGTQAGSSIFSLKNAHWQIIALDTAYEDAGLYGDQANWVRGLRAANPGLKTMLLSHHPLFSAYEQQPGSLGAQIGPVLAEQPIDAWFWGHEHRCLAYREHQNVRFSSCLGHGGIPEYLIANEGDPYPPPLLYDYRKRYGQGWEPWNTFGFAVVDLTGDAMSVTYVDEHGTRHYHVP